ncbi:LysR family transcriptional regulator [Legionella quateirensis]|uniref:LysR family transcriptional regulator n=1 Tax=Legionella quateirensis TaxID=45072 RepID=A0A378KWJ7_9GAMM|nr:LysR family transcriptional regulator [Legionella quateirensis]KTD50877.1 LysR family transcriptional regulator [Legionella quateirensis]STY17877.1 LysR family transcriptional regulator [Legionella quateirensis]
MDIASLRTFYAVSQLQSYTRAAKQLHITPSAVSKRISRLEMEVGASLFNQIGQTARLTEAGKLLLPFANTIIVASTDAIKSIKEIGDKAIGTIILGVTFFAGLYRLPKILKAFLIKYPEVNFDVRFQFPADLYLEIEKTNLDFGICTLIPLLPPHVRTLELWKEDMQVFVSTSHPLAQYGQLTTEILARYPAILPEPGYAIRDSVEHLFVEANNNLIVKMDMNNLEVIKELLLLGLGWGVLPTDFSSPELIALNVPGFPVCHTYYLVYHKGKKITKTEQKFIEFSTQFDFSLQIKS